MMFPKAEHMLTAAKPFKDIYSKINHAAKCGSYNVTVAINDHCNIYDIMEKLKKNGYKVNVIGYGYMLTLIPDKLISNVPVNIRGYILDIKSENIIITSLGKDFRAIVRYIGGSDVLIECLDLIPVTAEYLMCSNGIKFKIARVSRYNDDTRKITINWSGDES